MRKIEKLLRETKEEKDLRLLDLQVREIEAAMDASVRGAEKGVIDAERIVLNREDQLVRGAGTVIDLVMAQRQLVFTKDILEQAKAVKDEFFKDVK